MQVVIDFPVPRTNGQEIIDTAEFYRLLTQGLSQRYDGKTTKIEIHLNNAKETLRDELAALGWILEYREGYWCAWIKFCDDYAT